jgi:hypothetical protein
MEDAIRAAFFAGFRASGEGWNGEYPFSDHELPVEDDEYLKAEAGKHVAQALTASGYTKGDGEPPDWVHFCANCGRIIDGREKQDGGDDHGVELLDGIWACSYECWCALTAPEVK